jgi:uncharacterized membrane protein (Fun14 family)
MVNENVVPSPGIIETIKNSMQPEVIANRIGMDKNMLIDIGLYGAIGFIVGFLLKKYSEYFISLVLLIIAIVVLQHFDYISFSFNMPKIHEMLGLGAVATTGDSAMFFEWIKSNVAGSASCAVGFLVGLRVG